MFTNDKIVTFITHSPFCGGFCEEGLRFTLGAGTSMISHDLSLVLVGDGVWFAIKTLEQRDFDKYVKAFSALDGAMIVERESLKERNISEDLLKSEFQVMSRAEVFEILRSSDFSISY